MKMTKSQVKMEQATYLHKMNKIILVVFLSLFLVITSLIVLENFPALAEGSAFEIQWFSIDGGGSLSSNGGGYSLSGTIGQPDAGVISGGNFTVQGGFWNTDSADNLFETLLPVVVR